MSKDLGFTFNEHKGEYDIFHNGRKAAVLRGNQAMIFKDQLINSDFSSQQQLMARLTGNYKKGNERMAKNHPRNRGY